MRLGGYFFTRRTAHIRYDPTERLAWIARYREAKNVLTRGGDPAHTGLPGIGVPPGTLQNEKSHSANREAP